MWRGVVVFSQAALVVLAGCARQSGEPLLPPRGGVAEPSTAIESDISAMQRGAATAGAPVATPAAAAPALPLPKTAPPAVTAAPGALPSGGGPTSRAAGSPLGNPRLGHVFAQASCRPCHVVAPGQGSPVRFADAPDFVRVAREPRTTAFSLDVWLTNPHPTMPSLHLTPEERANVVAYILSLRR